MSFRLRQLADSDMLTREEVRVLTRPVFEGKGRTKQSMKDECDINNIVARYKKSGMLTHLAAGVPRFADVSELTEYRTAIENVRAADKYFAGLPAKVRALFDNDPATYVEVLTSPDAGEVLEELGLEMFEGRPRERPGEPAAPPSAGAPPEAPEAP